MSAYVGGKMTPPLPSTGSSSYLRWSATGPCWSSSHLLIASRSAFSVSVIALSLQVCKGDDLVLSGQVEFEEEMLQWHHAQLAGECASRQDQGKQNAPSRVADLSRFELVRPRVLQTPRRKQLDDRRRFDPISLVVRRIAGVNGGPGAARIKVEAAAHRRENIERTRDQCIPLLFPELSNSLRPQIADRLLLPWFLTNAKQHCAGNSRGRTIACIELEAVSAR